MEIGGAFAAFRSIRLLVLLNNVQFFETTTTSLRAIIGALAYNLKCAALCCCPGSEVAEYRLQVHW